MTDRITISVSDEIGAYLRRTGNASAAVARLVAAAIEREATLHLLRSAGYDVTPAFIEAGVQLAGHTPEVPPEVVAKVPGHRRSRIEEAKRRRFARPAT